MKEIGGYLELEICGGNGAYHQNALALNTARNALEQVLRTGGYKKIYLPLYNCIALQAAIDRAGIASETYAIDYNFEFEPFPVQADEAILYINFYGLKDAYIKQLSDIYPTLVIDNAHAFYSRPVHGVPTFYSCRKFFGVPDGAYLCYPPTDEIPAERDNSFDRYVHLIGRMDQTANDHFRFYRSVEDTIGDEPVRLISNSTARVMASIDYEATRSRRQSNYEILHRELASMNRLDIAPSCDGMCYPLLATRRLRDELIKLKVYTGVYWPQLITPAYEGTIEYDLSLNLVCLPTDHRYDENDMNEILNRIKSLTN